MAKRLKLTIIEKRLKKLHDVANFAEDYAKAIVGHVQFLSQEGQTEEQSIATAKMVKRLNDWVEMFTPLASEMQRVEALYHATADDDTAELIEAVPSTKDHPTEEPYKLMEQLCKIGYIQIEGDPYQTLEKKYSAEEIVSNVITLRKSLAICVNALANASYQGIWCKAGELAADTYEKFPQEDIEDFLSEYGTLEGVKKIVV